jgi:hypothetical protein
MTTNPHIAVLPAAREMGEPINGSHRVPIAEVRAVSPSENGNYSTVLLDQGVLVCALPAIEVAKLLGWD